MTFTKGGSLSREDVPQLAKEDEIYLRNSITNEGCEILAEVLQITTTLKALDFDGTSVIALQNINFIEALAKNRTIKLLYLYGTSYGVEGAKGLAAVLKENSTIEKIVWLKDRIGDEGVAALSEALKVNSTLQCLDLDRNNIGANGAKALADALKTNNALQRLGLDRNIIGANGAKALAYALKTNKALQCLDLDRNNIGANGAKALADALKTNKALQTLYLGHTIIGDDVAKALADALKENTTLKKLELSSNNIGEKGGKAFLDALQENRSSSIESIDLSGNKVSWGTQKQIDEEIDRIHNSNIDDGQVGKETLTGGFDGAVNERSINATGQLPMHTADEILVGASNEDAQINTERGDEIADAEIELKEQELQSTLSRLQRELAEKDKKIASLKDILKKIGMMVNSEDSDFNNEGGDPRHRVTASGDGNHRSLKEKDLQSEIDSLKEQLKNSRPIETVDLTNEVDPSTATEDDSNHEEPPSKRRRTKSNLANALEQSQQMVAVKEEAVQRAAAAEANAEAARWEKDAVEASLRGVQEDLEDANEVVTQQTLATDIWQGRFDEIFELARAAGVDGKTLSEIRHRPLSSGS